MTRNKFISVKFGLVEQVWRIAWLSVWDNDGLHQGIYIKAYDETRDKVRQIQGMIKYDTINSIREILDGGP
jgi:hypothetical protein